MRYTRLTREQLEVLHEEFARFLATQEITAEEWREIRAHKPELVEEELDLFSDLVWERSLSKIQYLERVDADAYYGYFYGETEARLLMVQVNDPAIDLHSNEGWEWLLQHIDTDTVEVYNGVQQFAKEDRNFEVFKMIRDGGMTVTDGKRLSKYFDGKNK